MLHQSLVAYIRAQMANGAKLLEIKDVLLRTGWSEADIYDAFGSIQQTTTLNAPSVEVKSKVIEKREPKVKFSSTRVGVIVLLLLFCLTVGAVFVVYSQNSHNTQTASEDLNMSLPADVK